MLFGHRKRTVKFWKLWDEIVACLLGMNDSTQGELRTAPYYMDLKGLYSGENNVTYVYTIDGYPAELELSYRSILRRECKDGVRISFVSTFERYKIQWSSPQMKSKLRTWRLLDSDGEDVDSYNIHDNMALLDSQAWRRESIEYLTDAEVRRKRKTFRFRSVMFVSGQRGENFNDTIKELVETCKVMNIKVTRVMLNIQDYLSVFSPFSLEYNDAVIKQCGSNVLTDEILARFNTYSQGTVGKSGLYWGTDIYSSFPCLKQTKKTAESNESWLITAEAGGGKSYFVKSLCFQLLADRHYNGTIMDIEGFEYLPLAAFLSEHDKVVVLNMAEGSGAYFDPVEIILTGDEDNDAGMYSLSTSFTLSIFKILLGGQEDDWTDIVINDAVSLTYSKRGVVQEDMSTWHRSKGLTLFDVYSTLKGLLSDVSEGSISNKFEHSDYDKRDNPDLMSRASDNDVNSLITTDPDYQKAVEMCLAKVSRYFERAGTRSSVFRKRISVEGIIHAKLVVCSFGMAGKSEVNVDPIQMSLMQLCAANISYLRSIFSKLAGKFNFKLWEEFQRWGGFPDSDKTITTALTGGRKLGDINIIVTNKVGDILDDDRFGIFSNITSIAIGCIWDAKIRSELCDRLSVHQMEPELNRLVTENKDLAAFSEGDTLTNNPYNKAFLIGLDKTVYALSRMSLPEDLSRSEIFRTGVATGGIEAIEAVAEELAENNWDELERRTLASNVQATDDELSFIDSIDF